MTSSRPIGAALRAPLLLASSSEAPPFRAAAPRLLTTTISVQPKPLTPGVQPSRHHRGFTVDTARTGAACCSPAWAPGFLGDSRGPVRGSTEEREMSASLTSPVLRNVATDAFLTPAATRPATHGDASRGGVGSALRCVLFSCVREGNNYRF